ncbi:putative coil containing protein [Vibrio phage 424E50-1]|nr:putative coil containing protein [Vibrio phage 424E50-1]
MASGNKGSIRGSVRKRAGAPTKEEQLKNKLAKAELKMEEVKVRLQGELTAANEKLVKEYTQYVEFLSDVALGKIKEASVTARIGACDKLIKRVDELKEELEMDGIDPDSVEDIEDEDENSVDVTNLIQVSFEG